MIDPDNELRAAVGHPPDDPEARTRALTRLRADMDATSRATTGAPKRPSRRAEIAAAVIGFACLALFSASGLRTPAAADQLERLARSSRGLGAGATSVATEQRYVSVGEDVASGQSYQLLIRSVVRHDTTADGSVVKTESISSVSFATPADRRAWRSMGAPKIVEPGDELRTRFDEPPYDVASIPTDPASLKAALVDGAVTGYELSDEEMFEQIGTILAQAELTPDQRVALYRVTASLDGIQLVGETVDPLGRVGIGFTRTVGGSRQTLIFDEATGQPLAAEQFPNGYQNEQPWSWFAFRYRTT